MPTGRGVRVRGVPFDIPPLERRMRVTMRIPRVKFVCLLSLVFADMGINGEYLTVLVLPLCYYILLVLYLILSVTSFAAHIYYLDINYPA